MMLLWSPPAVQLACTCDQKGKINSLKTRKNAIVEYLDCQIPVTQLKGPKRNGYMLAEKRDWNAPPTHDFNIWLCGR